MNERQDSLTGKLLNTRPFLFNLSFLNNSIKATRIELDLENECTFLDNFLGEIPEEYLNKKIEFITSIKYSKNKELQIWDQAIYCEDLNPLRIHYEFKI